VLHLPDNALVKGFANDDEVRLTVTGVDDAEEGRLRAVFAAYPLDVAVWPRPRDRRWWQNVGLRVACLVDARQGRGTAPEGTAEVQHRAFPTLGPYCPVRSLSVP